MLAQKLPWSSGRSLVPGLVAPARLVAALLQLQLLSCPMREVKVEEREPAFEGDLSWKRQYLQCRTGRASFARVAAAAPAARCSTARLAPAASFAPAAIVAHSACVAPAASLSAAAAALSCCSCHLCCYSCQLALAAALPAFRALCLPFLLLSSVPYCAPASCLQEVAKRFFCLAGRRSLFYWQSFFQRLPPSLAGEGYAFLECSALSHLFLHCICLWHGHCARSSWTFW